MVGGEPIWEKVVSCKQLSNKLLYTYYLILTAYNLSMIIDGKKIAEQKEIILRERVQALPFKPVFCDVLVGDDAVQRSYVHIKGRAAQRVGIAFSLQEFSSSITTPELIRAMAELSTLPNMAGLIVQLPLPGTLDTIEVLNAIDPMVDVDCIGPKNSYAFFSGQHVLPPPTAAAIITLLDSLNINFSDKQFLIVGQGPLVGKPVTHLLKQRNFNVATADRSTENLNMLLGSADVIISGVGKPGLITGDIIKSGSIVIDAGTAETDGGIVGDIDFDSVSKVASWASPVPGGVGPVTVSELLSNVVTVAERKVNKFKGV